MPAALQAFAALSLAVSLWAQIAAGQTAVAEKPAFDSPATAEAAKSQQSDEAQLPKVDQPAAAPDVFFLPDAAGKLRRIIGYRYEDFLKAWQEADHRQGELERPKYVISEFSGTLNASVDVAKAEFSVTVELQSDAWVQIPLSLASLIAEGATIQPDSDEFVTYDSKLNCYAAWLKGKPGDRRTINLSGALPLVRDGDEKLLVLEAPSAAKSSIEVTTPTAVEVEPFAKVLVESHSTAKDQITTRIEGVKQPVTIRWGPPGANRTRDVGAFEATTDLVVNVEPNRLSYEATIAVHGFGKPIDRLRVKLPAGSTASLAPRSDGLELSMAPTEVSSGAPIAEIRLTKPAGKPLPIHLLVESNGTEAAKSGALSVAPLEVLGAVRQRGSIAVRVSELLNAHFEPHGRVEQIDAAELPEGLRSRNVLAAFNASGTTWKLEIHTQRRQRKVRVTPTLAMQLGSQGAQLDVSLDYQIAGGQTFDLRVNLHGWELTEQPIESGGAVDLIEQHVTPEQVLIMPLKDSNAQEVRVKFSLRREAGLGVHELPLPEVLDASVLPGALSVTTDETWRATAQIDKCVGVAPAPPTNTTIVSESDPPGGSPTKSRTSLALQTFLPRARLAIDVSEREQLISVHSKLIGRFEGHVLKVEQRLDYDISFQPASELGMTVSTELLANEGLELLLDEKPLAPSAVDILPASGAVAPSEDGALRLVVRLPQPALGKLAFSIRSATPLNPAQLAGNALVSLPLALPDQPVDTTASVALGGGIRISLWSGPEAESWSSDLVPKGVDLATVSTFSVATSKPVTRLALRLSSPDLNSPQDLNIEAAWAQTWVVAGERQDRFVYRLNTDARRLEVSLPAEFEGQIVEATVNGVVTPAQRSSSGALAVDLPVAEGRRLVGLELRRRSPQSLSTWDELTASFPTIRGAGSTAPFVWQLVLPAQFSAIGSPTAFSAEYRLGWKSFRWGRQAIQSQADLERWSGASARPAPSPAMNQYVFTAFEMPDDVHLRVIRQLWVITVGGLTTLALGLALLYTRLAQSAVFWLSLCVAAGALLLSYPEAAAALVQAVMIGAGFTLLSALIKWLLAEGDRPPSSAALPSAASSIASLAATQAWAPGEGTDAGRPGTSAGSFQVTGATP